MTKIIFFDIDGTLHGFNETSIRPSVYAAIRRAREKGVLCFIATGRHPLEIEEENLLEQLEFDGYVYLNGSYCVDGEGNILHSQVIDPSQLKELLELKKTEDFSLLLMEANAMYIDSRTPLVDRMHELVHTRVPPVVEDLTPGLKKTIYQMIIFGEDDTLERLLEHLPLCSSTRWFNGATALDLIPLGGDKCSGIRDVLDYYGIDPADAAAVGDGMNDVEMLSMLGTGVAMGNACEAAKRAATLIAPSLEEDGLSWAVDRILER